MEQGQQIEKMAIVGDEKWRDDALAFTAKGFRPTAIEFFAPLRLNEARTWLAPRRFVVKFYPCANRNGFEETLSQGFECSCIHTAEKPKHFPRGKFGGRLWMLRMLN